MSAASRLVLGDSGLFDPRAPLTASGNLRRRTVVDRIVRAIATAAALFAVAMLVIVVYGVFVRGVSSLSLSFAFRNPQGLAGGGIFNYLLGTIEVVTLGAVIALPIGVLTGLYLTEFAGPRSRVAGFLKLALDVMQGLPTIVVGLFIYGLIVIPQHVQSGFAASIALAIVMVPLMARASQEVLLLVPGSLREAADALGVNRWRTVLTVILPSAVGGIATGAILAIARAAGETAPVLILDSIYNPSQTTLDIFHGVPTVPMLIFTSVELPIPEAVARAWGAALLLMLMILIANIGARLWLARTRTKMAR
ncbi:MAG: phosphate ABC transporter permease PstA [Solirubrobacterales bacterium]|nr:phosphate ABC transporter permease PstA [Solirubrobacterales bacterium]MBV9941428.1 phosphate ABC transporter permease PstA [Solirubrobacterales bacterium]